MRTPAIAGSVALGLILAACEATPTAAPDAVRVSASSTAPAEGVEFEGFIHFCESSPAEVFRVTPGGTVHIQDATNRNRWITDSPLVTGDVENIVDANINLNNDATGKAHLTVTIRPDVVNGTWEAKQQLDIVGGVPSGSRGVGRGTGALRGMTIKYVIEGPMPGDNVCNPDNPIAPVSGVIVSPATD